MKNSGFYKVLACLSVVIIVICFIICYMLIKDMKTKEPMQDDRVMEVQVAVQSFCGKSYDEYALSVKAGDIVEGELVFNTGEVLESVKGYVVNGGNKGFVFENGVLKVVI